MTAVQSGTRISWNQGRIVGPKPPLKPKNNCAIRTRLQHDGRVRDLALFSAAIESKLRGCDVVKLRVADIYLANKHRCVTVVVEHEVTGIAGHVIHLGVSLNSYEPLALR